MRYTVVSLEYCFTSGKRSLIKNKNDVRSNLGNKYASPQRGRCDPCPVDLCVCSHYLGRSDPVGVVLRRVSVGNKSRSS